MVQLRRESHDKAYKRKNIIIKEMIIKNSNKIDIMNEWIIITSELVYGKLKTVSVEQGKTASTVNY